MNDVTFNTQPQLEALLEKTRSADSMRVLNHVATAVDWGTRAVRLYCWKRTVLGIAIPLTEKETEKSWKRRKTTGLDIKIDKLDMEKAGKYEPFLLIECAQLGLLKPFADFANALLESLYHTEQSSSSDTSQEIVWQQFENWRALLKNAATETFSEEEEIGLLCELEVLKHLITTSGDPSVLDAWTGPNRKRHDFSFADKSIECKATRSANGLTISIHGAEQLEPDAGKKLYLVARRYQHNTKGELSIPRLIKELTENTSVDRQKLQRLIVETKCPYYNLSEQDNEEFFGKWVAKSTAEFEVGEDFPKLGLPEDFSRVQNVRYNLDLSEPTQVPGHRENPSFVPDSIDTDKQ